MGEIERVDGRNHIDAYVSSLFIFEIMCRLVRNIATAGSALSAPAILLMCRFGSPIRHEQGIMKLNVFRMPQNERHRRVMAQFLQVEKVTECESPEQYSQAHELLSTEETGRSALKMQYVAPALH